MPLYEFISLSADLRLAKRPVNQHCSTDRSESLTSSLCMGQVQDWWWHRSWRGGSPEGGGGEERRRPGGGEEGERGARRHSLPQGRRHVLRTQVRSPDGWAPWDLGPVTGHGQVSREQCTLCDTPLDSCGLSGVTRYTGVSQSLVLLLRTITRSCLPGCCGLQTWDQHGWSNTWFVSSIPGPWCNDVRGCVCVRQRFRHRRDLWVDVKVPEMVGGGGWS